MTVDLSVFVLFLCSVHIGAALANGENAQQNPKVNQAQVDQSLNDLNDRLTKVRAVPNFENGKPAGYKVVQPQPGGAYEKLELKNGDVIQGVNGQKANDPLKVVRDGDEQTVDQNANREPATNQDNPSQ